MTEQTFLAFARQVLRLGYHEALRLLLEAAGDPDRAIELYLERANS